MTNMQYVRSPEIAIKVITGACRMTKCPLLDKKQQNNTSEKANNLGRRRRRGANETWPSITSPFHARTKMHRPPILGEYFFFCVCVNSLAFLLLLPPITNTQFPCCVNVRTGRNKVFPPSSSRSYCDFPPSQPKRGKIFEKVA